MYIYETSVVVEILPVCACSLELNLTEVTQVNGITLMLFKLLNRMRLSLLSRLYTRKSKLTEASFFALQAARLLRDA